MSELIFCSSESKTKIPHTRRRARGHGVAAATQPPVHDSTRTTQKQASSRSSGAEEETTATLRLSPKAHKTGRSPLTRPRRASSTRPGPRRSRRA
eukprot:2979796-Prymnesium_polylepis.2